MKYKGGKLKGVVEQYWLIMRCWLYNMWLICGPCSLLAGVYLNLIFFRDQYIVDNNNGDKPTFFTSVASNVT